jgi:DNA repair protein RadA/Sms
VARSETHFACTECGHQTPRWMGRCPACGEWNTLVEERNSLTAAASGRSGGRGNGVKGGFGHGAGGTVSRPMPLAEVEPLAVERLGTGSGELDRVLGGGLVPGSIVLIGGSPGIGKSTLMSSTLAALERSGRRTLYVSGEESASQIRLRAERLGPDALRVPVLAETSLEAVLAWLEAERPDVCVIDSVQTLHAEPLGGAAGSVGQVREVAARLERFAREASTTVVLVGHVTKDGALAGPRVLEHAVDCVLQFEGERERTYRVLRALKNRFGPTNEVGVFEMRSGGLSEVADPSARFLRDASAIPGSCMLCAMEGSRPVLVEVQALVAPTEVVPPRRIANGIDRNRLSLVLAVLARHVGRRSGGGHPLASADVFVSLAGGVRVEEPGADLAVALAIASAATGISAGDGDRPLGCFGEIGLTGELRYVAHADRRLEEASRFGLGRAIVPSACIERDITESSLPTRTVAADTVAEALSLALDATEHEDTRAA